MGGEPAADTGTGSNPDILIGRIAEKLGIDLADKTDPVAMLQAIYDGLPDKGKDSGGSEGGDKADDTVASKEVLSALGLEEGASKDRIMLVLTDLQARAEAHKDVAALQSRINELEANDAKRNADVLINEAIQANKLNPNHESRMTYARNMALTDPKQFEQWMACTEAYAPPGKTNAPPGGGGGNGRETVIANAARAFNEDPNIARLTGKAAWVGEALRKEGRNALTEKEREALN